MGPLPTASYSGAWTSPIKVSSLDNCNHLTPSSSTQLTATSTLVANSIASNPNPTINSKVFSGSNTQSLINAIYFDNTYWYWPETTPGLTEMDTNITPMSDGSPDGYFFANQFYFAKASDSFTGYLGLDTEGQGSSGKTAVFTIWGSISSSGPGHNISGSQGDKSYYSSQIKYNWSPNHTYDLKLELVDKSSSTNTWSATVTDLSTKVSSVIGSIKTPAWIGTLDTKSATFHERYSTVASCDNIHQSAVEFSNLTANNGSINSTFHATMPPSSSVCTGEYETENMPHGLVNIMW